MGALGIIGYGAIADLALNAVATHRQAPLDEVICLARPTSQDRARELLERMCSKLATKRRVVCTVAELVAGRPDLIVEAAGHEVVRDAGPEILRGGIDLLISSVGALSDTDIRATLALAAGEGRARYHLLPGAIGGLDILAAARLAGLDEVKYVLRKPPMAWIGTAAESMLDLRAIVSDTIIFEGDAKTAAAMFPKNANVAATVALAGLGFERTRVTLVADAKTRNNIHEIAFKSACADVSIRIEGRPSPQNPKTSSTTGYSLAHAILERFANQNS